MAQQYPVLLMVVVGNKVLVAQMTMEKMVGHVALVAVMVAWVAGLVESVQLVVMAEMEVRLGVAEVLVVLDELVEAMVAMGPEEKLESIHGRR